MVHFTLECLFFVFFTQTVVVYSAPNITSRKSNKLPQRSEKAAEGGTVYTDVSASAVE